DGKRFIPSIALFPLSAFVFLFWILSIRVPVGNGKSLCQYLCLHTNNPTARDNSCYLTISVFQLRILLWRVRILWQEQTSCSTPLLANTQQGAIDCIVAKCVAICCGLSVLYANKQYLLLNDTLRRRSRCRRLPNSNFPVQSVFCPTNFCLGYQTGLLRLCRLFWLQVGSSGSTSMQVKRLFAEYLYTCSLLVSALVLQLPNKSLYGFADCQF